MTKAIKTKLSPIILTFILISTLTVFIAGLKLLTHPKTDVYVNIKLSQGLWWSNTTKPSYWFTQAFKIGDQALDLIGKPLAKIENLTYYPANIELNPNQYDLYLTVKLSTKYSAKTKTYQFNRSQLAVGSPININFPTTELTGTIIKLSPTPLPNSLIEKTVILVKKNSFLWELDAIPLDDQYFNGADSVFQLIDKQAQNTSIIASDSLGNLRDYINTGTQYLTITAKIKFKELNGQYFFAEDQLAVPGNQLSIITPNFNYSYFTIAKIY